MKSNATTPEEYIDSAESKWKSILEKLRKTVLDNLPEGFQETMNYGMIGYVVSHDVYPSGYHVNPMHPIPYINIAAQKKTVSLYHMGIYANEKLYRWFLDTYQEKYQKKLNMGKACFRFKKDEDVPYDLIGELVRRVGVTAYIRGYEKARRRHKE